MFWVLPDLLEEGSLGGEKEQCCRAHMKEYLLPWSQNRWDIWGEEGEQEFELAGDTQKRSWWMLKAGPSPGLPKRVKLLLFPSLGAQWD